MLSSLQKLAGFRLLIIQKKMCTFGRSCLNWGSLQVEKENKAEFDKKKVSTWTWFGWNCTQLSVPCEQTKSSFEKYGLLVKRNISSLVWPWCQLKLNKLTCSLSSLYLLPYCYPGFLFLPRQQPYWIRGPAHLSMTSS